MSAKDPLRYFRVEAREIAEELARSAREIEQTPTPDTVARMMRLTHTLKGAAAVVKQRAVAECAHALEDALAAVRGQEGAPSASVVEAINGQIAALEELVAQLDRAPPKPGAGSPRVALDENFGLLSAEAREVDLLTDGIATARVGMRRLRTTMAALERARDLAELISDWTNRARIHGEGADATPRMRKFAQDLRALLAEAEQGLRDGIDQNERQLAEAHGAAEQLRLMPCGAAFTALERAAQESAHSIGKQITVSVRGGNIRLDPQVLGLVRRALVQMLRNAVAHGIETPLGRAAAGKGDTGHISIGIVRRGDRIIVTCSDDGAGIDLAAVRAAAEARGLPIGDGSEGALLELLLSGGLSTSHAVTEAAGRGVGLDVVRETAQRLGAHLTASTETGRGTSVSLSIPVRLSSLDALLVEAGGTTVAIPLESVRKALRIGPADIARSAETETIVHDGEAVSLKSLSRTMQLGTATERGGTSPVVILGGERSCMAFRVDAIAGIANLVVRRLPSLARPDPIVSGAWFDADGTPRPVADVEALVQAAALAMPVKPKPAPPPSHAILVIDDSMTTRVLEQSILESAGFTVELATCAEEALEMARKRRYDLFLVDVEMPGMDGFAFVETTRADPELAQTPALLLSSRASQEDIDRGIRAGAKAYFVKSEFDQRQVLDTIRSLLGPQ